MYRRFGKRLADIVASAAALVVLSPLLLVLTVLGAAMIGENPFFVQIRPGKDEKLFRLVKFRSMTSKRDEQGRLLPDEQRLTRYGRFLRRSSLDELPQLWNILKGDISIVGPRPQLVRDMVFMTAQQRKRHDARQGLTGLAQVNGRNGLDWEEKIAYDLAYIEDITLAGDLKIIAATAKTVLTGTGVSAEDMDTAQDLGDYLLSTGQVSREAYEQKQQQARQLLKDFAPKGEPKWKKRNHFRSA